MEKRGALGRSGVEMFHLASGLEICVQNHSMIIFQAGTSWDLSFPFVRVFVHVFLVVRSYSLHVSNCVTDCATSFPPLSWPRRKVQCKYWCLRCSLLGVDWIDEIFTGSFTTMRIEATMMCSRRLDDRAYVLFFSIPLSVGLTWHGSCW